MAYHSMQLGDIPPAERIEAELESIYRALQALCALRIQTAIRGFLARMRYARRLRRRLGDSSGSDTESDDEPERAVAATERAYSSWSDSDRSESESDDASDGSEASELRPPRGVHVCSLDLSLNQLFALDAAALAPLAWLCAIDVSLNQLTTLDAFASARLPRLRELVVANNQLVSLVGVGLHTSLTALDASYNALPSLDGLRPLARLRALSVAANCLRALDGAGDLPALRTLVAHHNGALSSAEGVRGARALTALDVSSCRLDSLDALVAMCGALPSLAELACHDNAPFGALDYSAQLISALPKLAVLDETPLSARIRAHATRTLAGRSAEALVAEAHGAVERQLLAREDKFHREVAELERRQAQLTVEFGRSQREAASRLAAYEGSVRQSLGGSVDYLPKLARLRALRGAAAGASDEALASALAPIDSERERGAAEARLDTAGRDGATGPDDDARSDEDGSDDDSDQDESDSESTDDS
jgi:hypothetical protein